MQMKNNMILRLGQTVMAVLIPLAAFGQSLNPTVEVSKTYEGKLMEAHKPLLKMAVPDSVYRFDLDFDYSVAETPYKGSYEFNPYSVEMAPSPTLRNIRTLYLKAGAGYQMHPVLDIVWSPEFRKPFLMNVYASHESFVGRYWKMGLVPDGPEKLRADHFGKGYEGGRTWFGYDFLSRAGVQGRYDWDNLLFRFDVVGEGLQQKTVFDMDRSYLAVDVKAGVASKAGASGLNYRVDAAYRYGEDYMSGNLPSGLGVKENDLEVDASIGFLIDNGHRIVLDFGLDIVSTDGSLVANGADVDIVPHYLISLDRWNFDLGLRYSSTSKTVSISEFYNYTGQLLYPDVRIEYMLIKNAMKAYFNLGGDSRVTSYSDVLRHNRHADMFYGCGRWNMLDVSEERVNASLGFEGRIGTRFSYDLKGGYVNMGNALLDGMVQFGDVLAPAVGYSSYDSLYASLDWLLDTDCFRFDGSVGYSHVFNMSYEDRLGLFSPAALKGDVSVSYNWKKRIVVGLDCAFSSSRLGHLVNAGAEDGSFLPVTIPAYADLGLNAEYAVTRKLSVWFRGGNLLGMTIQRNLLYAERGPYFTAGICLNL